MKALVVACFAVVAAGCQALKPASHPLVYSGGDGSSCEKAVVIGEAKYRETGVMAERLWLEKKYPGYHEAKKSVLNAKSKQYDVVEIATAEGEAKKVYFDATDFANK